MFRPRDNRQVLLTTLFLSLLLCETTEAQSGRRANRTVPAETPTPALLPTPETAPPRKKIAELNYPVHLLIAKHYTSKHLASEDVIFNSFIQRLNELPKIEGTLIGSLNRDQAAKRAVSETDSYVVLLEFEIDNFQGGKVVINSPDLEVKYYIYAPHVLQPQLKGKVYYQTIGGPQGRKANSPGDPPIRITAEAAGHEAAERLYFWFAEVVGTKQER